MRHIISLKEQSSQDLKTILQIAKKLKTDFKSHRTNDYLKNQTLIMLFQKSSTRTRLSFEAAMTQLGGHSIFLESRTSQFSLTDFGHEIQAVMRFGQALMFRAMKVADVNTTASYNQIPVIDACSEKYHPCQALGDILTMSESSGGLENIGPVAWLGIENNVSNTLKLACAKLGIKINIVSPEVDPDSIDEALNKQANDTGNVFYTSDIVKGLQGVAYVHTDTWTNMEFFENGQVKENFISEYQRRKKVFAPYQLNSKLINTHAAKAKIMHCMPCHLGYEITKDAVEHKNSLIFDQAENRLHIQKAILIWLMEKEHMVL